MWYYCVLGGGLPTGLSDWMYILRMYTLSHTSIVYKAITYRAYLDHKSELVYSIILYIYGALVILGFEDLRPYLYKGYII